MTTIKISDEDFKFLKDLQEELNNQENDGNAAPVYWGIMEDYEALCFEGEGEPRIPYDDGTFTLEELAEAIEDDIDSFTQAEKAEWDAINKNDLDSVMDFVNEHWNEDRTIGEPYWVEIKQQLSRYAGAFLTKRAAKNYIENYGYNHDNPRTYAMTAYRNFELDRLIKILKTIDLSQGKQK
jgi:hypothetical protein